MFSFSPVKKKSEVTCVQPPVHPRMSIKMLLCAKCLHICCCQLHPTSLGIWSSKPGDWSLIFNLWLSINHCPWLLKEMKLSGRNTSSTFVLQGSHSPLEKTGRKRRENRAVWDQLLEATTSWASCLWNPKQTMAFWEPRWVFRKQSETFQDPEALKCVWTHTEPRTLYSQLWSQAGTTHVHTQKAPE